MTYLSNQERQNFLFSCIQQQTEETPKFLLLPLCIGEIYWIQQQRDKAIEYFLVLEHAAEALIQRDTLEGSENQKKIDLLILSRFGMAQFLQGDKETASKYFQKVSLLSNHSVS